MANHSFAYSVKYPQTDWSIIASYIHGHKRINLTDLLTPPPAQTMHTYFH